MEDVLRGRGDTSKSTLEKSAEVSEIGDVPLTREEDSPAPKKRKASEPEADTRNFTEKSTLEKASLFDSLAKQFISRADLKLIRGLPEEEEVEQLHSSLIDVS